jgi:alkanesulfonate monooxygenase SsuD/methylene tetrahydromethanopterin reductase-like flavin-dependent oxidoreductase (luciferase family)
MRELMQRLWAEPSVEFHGRFYDLPPAGMGPKPRSNPHPPFVFGGITPIALRRAAARGDGWLGVGLDVDGVARAVAELQRLRAKSVRSDPLEISISWGEPLTEGDLEALASAGVDRLVVRPWTSGRHAVDRITAFAEQFSVSSASPG